MAEKKEPPAQQQEKEEKEKWWRRPLKIVVDPKTIQQARELQQLEEEEGLSAGLDMPDSYENWLTQMSLHQRQVVFRSWKTFGVSGINAGMLVYLDIFDEQPDLKKQFGVENRSNDKLSSDPIIMAAAKAIVLQTLGSALVFVIERITNETMLGQVVIPYLRDLGGRHYQMRKRGFRSRHFDYFSHSFTDCLIKWDGGEIKGKGVDKWPAKQAQRDKIRAWRIFLHLVLSEMRKGYEMAEAESHGRTVEAVTREQRDAGGVFVTGNVTVVMPYFPPGGIVDERKLEKQRLRALVAETGTHEDVAKAMERMKVQFAESVKDGVVKAVAAGTKEDSSKYGASTPAVPSTTTTTNGVGSNPPTTAAALAAIAKAMKSVVAGSTVTTTTTTQPRGSVTSTTAAATKQHRPSIATTTVAITTATTTTTRSSTIAKQQRLLTAIATASAKPATAKQHRSLTATAQPWPQALQQPIRAVPEPSPCNKLPRHTNKLVANVSSNFHRSTSTPEHLHNLHKHQQQQLVVPHVPLMQTGQQPPSVVWSRAAFTPIVTSGSVNPYLTNYNEHVEYFSSGESSDGEDGLLHLSLPPSRPHRRNRTRHRTWNQPSWKHGQYGGTAMTMAADGERQPQHWPDNAIAAGMDGSRQKARRTRHLSASANPFRSRSLQPRRSAQQHAPHFDFAPTHIDRFLSRVDSGGLSHSHTFASFPSEPVELENYV